jgi:hypothetical protein
METLMEENLTFAAEEAARLAAMNTGIELAGLAGTISELAGNPMTGAGLSMYAMQGQMAAADWYRDRGTPLSFTEPADYSGVGVGPENPKKNRAWDSFMNRTGRRHMLESETSESNPFAIAIVAPKSNPRRN